MKMKSNWRQMEKLGQIFSEQRRTRRKSGGPVREFPPQPVGSSEVPNLLLRKELCQPLTTFTNHQALGRASSGKLQQKSRRKELEKTCLLSSHRPYQAAYWRSSTAPVRRAFFEARGHTYPRTAQEGLSS